MDASDLVAGGAVMCAARGALFLVVALCLLGGCAQRAGPDDGTHFDAAAEHVYRCVAPRPVPEVVSCNDLGEENLCLTWALDYAAGAIPIQQCLYPWFSSSHDASCAQGWCEVVDGSYDCHCGNEPACGPGKVCVADEPDATAYCRCTMQ